MDWKKTVRRSTKAIFLISACFLSAFPLALRLRRPPDIVISLKKSSPVIYDVATKAEEASVADPEIDKHTSIGIAAFEPEDNPTSGDTVNKSATQADAVETIFVHVAGSVAKPGLYELPADSRVSHAIDAAGGMTEDASSSAVNIALPLRDGQQVFIPTEMRLATSPASREPVLQEDLQDNVAVPTLDDHVEGRLDVTSTEPSATESQLPRTDFHQIVDINSAGQAELEGLPGIGPSLAQKIIEYREMNGPFENAEELMEVSGIGTSKYAALKDRIVAH